MARLWKMGKIVVTVTVALLGLVLVNALEQSSCSAPPLLKRAETQIHEVSPPLIDVQPLFSDSGDSQHEKKEAIRLIGKACREWGFFQIINHSIDPDLMERTKSEMKRFFNLPLEAKLEVKRTVNNARGYANDELTKQKRDWKEIFDFGHVLYPHLDENDPLNVCLDGRNFWPNQLSNFKSTMKEYYEANVKLAEVILNAIAESLEVDPVFFSSAFCNHTSFARLNYYPPLETTSLTASESLGIGRHTDAGGLTLLWQESAGLQVYSGTKEDNNDGHWVDVIPFSNSTLTINIGDMMHVWTGGLYMAPEHRVKASTERQRFSIPFFYNPSYETVVKVMDELKGAHQSYRPFSWGKFRQARFAGDYADVGKETQIEDWEIKCSTIK